MTPRSISFLLLLLFISLPVHSQICSISSGSNDLLQSGTRTIYNGFSNNPLNREHAFTIQVTSFTFPSTGVQVAACRYLLTQRPLSFLYSQQTA